MKENFKMLIKYVLLNNKTYYKLLTYLEENYNDYFKKHNINLKKFYKEHNKLNVYFLEKIIFKFIEKNKDNKDLMSKLLYNILNIHPDKDIILKLFSNKENNDKQEQQKQEENTKNENEQLNKNAQTKPLFNLPTNNNAQTNNNAEINNNAQTKPLFNLPTNNNAQTNNNAEINNNAQTKPMFNIPKFRFSSDDENLNNKCASEKYYKYIPFTLFTLSFTLLIILLSQYNRNYDNYR